MVKSAVFWGITRRKPDFKVTKRAVYHLGVVEFRRRNTTA
jgi:hypothetical protein